MNEMLGPLWAFLDFQEMTATIVQGNKIFLAIRGVVAVIGAVLAWYISGPVFRGLYWLVVRKAIPMLLSVPLRVVVAGAAAVALFYFLPIGSGGMGGLGSGGGKGDGVGPHSGNKGTGPGTDSNNKNNGTNPSSSPDKNGAEIIDLELLGGDKYEKDGKPIYGEGKYYKVKTAKGESVKTFAELQALFNEYKDHVVVNLYIREEYSVEGEPREHLVNEMVKRKIKSVPK